MTKLAIISDLHIDSNQFTEHEFEIFNRLLMKNKIEHIHFNGDISNDFKGISHDFFNQLPIPYSCNLGNHDMVGLSETEIEAADFQVIEFENAVLLAFHGWYDYSFMPEDSNVEKIINFKNAFYFDRKIKRELSDIETTQKILCRLESKLEAISKPLIISTHFVPHEDFIINPRYEKFARFNAYLGSKHFHGLFQKFPLVKDVTFGHAHYRMENQNRDGIRYHARAFGYRYEWQMVNDFLEKFPQYKIPENWQLRKRFQAIRALDEWQLFKSEHLEKEFEKALIIFDV